MIKKDILFVPRKLNEKLIVGYHQGNKLQSNVSASIEKLKYTQNLQLNTEGKVYKGRIKNMQNLDKYLLVETEKNLLVYEITHEALLSKSEGQIDLVKMDLAVQKTINHLKKKKISKRNRNKKLEEENSDRESEDSFDELLNENQSQEAEEEKISQNQSVEESGNEQPQKQNKIQAMIEQQVNQFSDTDDEPLSDID